MPGHLEFKKVSKSHLFYFASLCSCFVHSVNLTDRGFLSRLHDGLRVDSGNVGAYKWLYRIVFLQVLEFGVAGLFLSPLIVVQQYFDKRGAFAAGIATVGIGVAAILTGPLYTVLLNHYGWRGTVMMHTGLPKTE